MNATELFIQSGESAGIYFCGQCKRVAYDGRQGAERCCLPHKCITCGKDEETRECPECSDARFAKQERERFEKAEKITEWGGWVFCDGNYGYKDGYFESVSDLMDWIGDHNADYPQLEINLEYVWPCKETEFVCVDVDDIYERIEERGYEDFERGSLVGTNELEAAIAVFEKANESIVSYEPDYSRALLLQSVTTQL